MMYVAFASADVRPEAGTAISIEARPTTAASAAKDLKCNVFLLSQLGTETPSRHRATTRRRRRDHAERNPPRERVQDRAKLGPAVCRRRRAGGCRPFARSALPGRSR